MSRSTRIALAGLLIGASLVAAYWLVAVRPRLARIEGRVPLVEEGRSRRIKARVNPVADFDREFALPNDPMGLVANGTELLAGNRGAPGGFLRIRPLSPEEIEVSLVKVREEAYLQEIAFGAIAANAKQVVAYADAGWFQSSGNVFTIHDPGTLKLLRHVPAPPLLGCLAWTGDGYWAATRKNTEASGEAAFLYRLDPALAVVRKYPAPGPGCQGMAWDGGMLWTADVFTDRISIFDLSAGEPALVSANQTSFPYLSGLAILGGQVWITEYGGKTLRHLNPRAKTAWMGGRGLELAEPVASPTEIAERFGPEELAKLREELRDEGWAARSRARQKLEAHGYPVDFDRAQGRSEAPDEDVAFLDWSVEAKAGAIRAAYRIHFGRRLFGSRAPSGAIVSVPVFARFRFTVSGAQLARPIEREFDAQPGENRGVDVLLAEDVGPGTYDVSLFVHVQWYDEEGGAHILNTSARSLEVGL